MNDEVRSASAARREARFTIAQFWQIAESGALDAFARTELLDGRISVMSAQHVPHAAVRKSIYDALLDCLRDQRGLSVNFEATIELGERNAPIPDVFIWEPTNASRGVPGSSVRLVVEVADSSERHDLGAKRRIYARHGIPEYWVAVLRTRTIERFAELQGKDYARHDSLAFADGVRSLTLPGVAVPAGAIA